MKILNEIKWAYQRVVRGYDDRIFWGFNDYFANFITAIKQFCESYLKHEYCDLNPEKKEVNKCEKMGIEHAWRKTPQMCGFSTLDKETCANCGLSRTHWYETREGYSYSDGRPDKPIINMKPV